jgi:uncharacterized membrane protein YeaQ/YmgE (transglycosylase-associated protein family)
MSLETIIIWLIIGAIAGWLAGVVVKGAGFGLVGNIVIGIIGAAVAGWLLPKLGIVIGAGFVGAVEAFENSVLVPGGDFFALAQHF